MCCTCEYSEDFLLYGDEGTCGNGANIIGVIFCAMWFIAAGTTALYLTLESGEFSFIWLVAIPAALLGLAFTFLAIFHGRECECKKFRGCKK